MNNKIKELYKLQFTTKTDLIKELLFTQRAWLSSDIQTYEQQIDDAFDDDDDRKFIEQAGVGESGIAYDSAINQFNQSNELLELLK